MPNVLAIHAHPDDIEIQCSGTLALLKDVGCEINIITMTPGDKGSAELGAVEISAVRRSEAQAAADLMGASYECLEFRDLAICFDNASRQRVAEALRRTQPDIVITAPPVDYMPDHEVTCQLVRDACFNAAVPNYVTDQINPAGLLKKIPHLYYVDSIEGVDWFGNLIDPQFIVDISTTFELKQNMLACHSSQRDWLREQHGMDEYLDSNERWSKKRGSEIGATYGEGFRQHKGHPYPSDNVILQLLGKE
jgi:LmbE family N-acetylglucosaminyl deacetylase